MTSYLDQPLAVDQYSRYFSNVFDESEYIWNPTGFLSIFGRPEANGSETIYSPNALDVDIDIIRGNEKIAKLLPRGMVSRPLGSTQQNLNVEKFTAFSRTFPLSEEEGDINAHKLLSRDGGETPYEGRDKFTRLRNRASRINKESVRRTIRLWEFLASQSILEGQMPAILGTVDPDLIYDWNRNPAHISTLGTAWTNVASDPLADIDAAWRLGRTNGRCSMDYAIWGEDVINAFIQHADVVEKSDNRRFNMIYVDQEMEVPSQFKFLVDGGMTPRIKVFTPGGHKFLVFGYSDTKDDDTGTAVDLMPAGYALFGYSKARCDRYFGPAELLPNIPQKMDFYRQMFGFNPEAMPMPANVRNAGHVLNPAMFYFDAYASADWKKVTCRTQSAPIFPTTQTDCFVTYKGVA